MPGVGHAAFLARIRRRDDPLDPYRRKRLVRQTLAPHLEVADLSRADGGAVGIWPDADAPQQRWAVTPVGDGYHVLTNRLSGRSLNVSGASTADGANVDQWEYVSAPQEQRQIIPV